MYTRDRPLVEAGARLLEPFLGPSDLCCLGYSTKTNSKLQPALAKPSLLGCFALCALCSRAEPGRVLSAPFARNARAVALDLLDSLHLQDGHC